MVWIYLSILLLTFIVSVVLLKKSFKYLNNEYRDINKKINSEPFFLYSSSSYRDKKGVKLKNMALLIFISGFLITFIVMLILSSQ